MTVYNTDFLKHRRYFFSFFAIIIGSISISQTAFGQVDYYYGLDKKGFRVGLGAGVSVLQTNWTSNPPGYALLLNGDYDINPFFSFGLAAQIGQLTGEDGTGGAAKYSIYKATNSYKSINLGLKTAWGFYQHITKSRNWLTDARNRTYIGVGIGEIFSSVIFAAHTDGANVQPSANARTLENKGPGSAAAKGGSFTVPVNLGTYIDFPGFVGNDKFEINPNFQYCFVGSPIFDGYQPNINNTNGGFYYTISVAVRYKLRIKTKEINY